MLSLLLLLKDLRASVSDRIKKKLVWFIPIEL